MRGPDLRRRGNNRGMRDIKKRPRPSGLYCPNCLFSVEARSDAMKTSVGNRRKVARVSTYLCPSCVKVYVRSRVLSFDQMVSVKFLRSKNR